MSEAHFILIVEPNIGDALYLEAAFRLHTVRHPARVLRNGYELRSYLKGAGVYANRELFPLPSLLLLCFCEAIPAINMLEWLRDSGYLDHFPVIGIGSDIQNYTLQLAFDLGLNGYFEKPNDLSVLAATICDLEWVEGKTLSFRDQPEVQLITKELFSRGTPE